MSASRFLRNNLRNPPSPVRGTPETPLGAKVSTHTQSAMPGLAQRMRRKHTEAVPRELERSDLDLLAAIKPLLSHDEDAISKKRKPIGETRRYPPVRRGMPTNASDHRHDRPIQEPSRVQEQRSSLRPLVPDSLHLGGAGTGRFGRQRGPRH